MSVLGAPTALRATLDELRTLATAHPDGLIDCNLGTPCDPVPEFVTEAVRASVAKSGPYPLSIGSVEYRNAARAWVTRRFGVELGIEHVAACIGTKEFVASLPRWLRLLQRDVGGDTRSSARDTVLYPSVSYPTYAVGAQLAGCRAVPVPLDTRWLLDFDAIDTSDANRALVLWLNVPGNPTGAIAGLEYLERAAAWGREHGVLVVSDECYVEFARDAHSIVEVATHGVLALHSLSKRSNFAGMRTGFYAGDAKLVAQLSEIRREAGLIVATPVQAGAIAALGDDDHVRAQHVRYEQRREFVLARLAHHGLHHVGGPMPFYLWLRSDDAVSDGLAIAMRCARAGWLIAPGETFGVAGTPFARIALVQSDETLRRALERFDACDPLTPADSPTRDLLESNE